MWMYILLALLNGFCIAIARILNGQLSVSRGPFSASFINHVGGFLFLTLVMLYLLSPPLLSGGSVVMYGGGVIGALYVAINSLVMTRLGSTNTIILVISGQMLVSLLLDSPTNNDGEMLLKLSGVMLIVAGIALKELMPRFRSHKVV
ncbi:DMT family transporter [Vibrio sp. HN007]|uniref:DMT family transporter n=1 Tax=Vibrio iocasae TaxID=3098914 RepID=UPI0035D49B59